MYALMHEHTLACFGFFLQTKLYRNIGWNKTRIYTLNIIMEYETFLGTFQC